MTNEKLFGYIKQQMVLAYLVAMVFLIAACVAPATPESAQTSDATTSAEDAPAEAGVSAPDGTLRVGMEIPVQLDPAFASSDVEIAILNAVYDYLVDVDAENNIQPRLATDWEVSEDGLTYTFTLAPNVTFHDGSPLTAEDVVW